MIKFVDNGDKVIFNDFTVADFERAYQSLCDVVQQVELGSDQDDKNCIPVYRLTIKKFRLLIDSYTIGCDSNEN